MAAITGFLIVVVKMTVRLSTSESAPPPGTHTQRQHPVTLNVREGSFCPNPAGTGTIVLHGWVAQQCP